MQDMSVIQFIIVSLFRYSTIWLFDGLSCCCSCPDVLTKSYICNESKHKYIAIENDNKSFVLNLMAVKLIVANDHHHDHGCDNGDNRDRCLHMWFENTICYKSSTSPSHPRLHYNLYNNNNNNELSSIC